MKQLLRSFLCLALTAGALQVSAQPTGYISIPDPAQQGSIAKFHRTSTNHYISLGTSGAGFSNHEIIYWDANFHPVWNHNFAMAAVLYWIDVIETNDGNFVAFGANQNNGGCNIAVKFNTAGTILWQKEYYIASTFLTSFCVSKAAGNDPGFVFGGGACAASSFLVRCDANGNILWQHQYFITASAGVQTTWSIIPENNAYVLGGNYLNGSQNDVFFTKVDSAGAWLFTTLVNEPTLNEIPSKMIRLSTGNYAMICGYNSNPNWAALIYYFSPTGTVFQGTKFVHPSQYQIDFMDLAEVSNGQLIVVGDVNDSPMKYMFMELNTGGVPNWQKKATGVTPGYLNGTCYGVTKTPNGNFAVAGAAYTDSRSIVVIDSTGAGYCNAVTSTVSVVPPDAFTMATATPVIIPPNILAQAVTNASTTLTLTTSTLCGTLGMNEIEENNALVVYPNPVRDQLTLVMDDKVVGSARVTFWNVLGEQVYAVNVMGNVVDVSGLTAGVYLMEVVVDGERVVRRVVKE